MTTVVDQLVRHLDPSEGHVGVRDRAEGLLAAAVGHDLAVWATVDPATVMTTSCRVYGAARDAELEAAVFAHEYAPHADVLRYADLAAGPLVGTVRTATGGDPSRSARHRDALAPRGFTDHLRLVLHDGRTAWGVLDLLRAGGTFTDDEVATTAAAGRPVARSLRTAMTAARVDGPADPVAVPLEVEGSGLLLCAPDGRVLEVSEEARWLLGLGDGPVELPAAVTALVAVVATGRGGTSASAPTGTGRWLTFTATALGGHVAVVVEEIRPSRLADVVARARGLSAREQEVLALIARGRSNRLIARELRLSEWTVQDHVKAVLAKFGAAGRGELLAALFTGHYAALHAAATG